MQQRAGEMTTVIVDNYDEDLTILEKKIKRIKVFMFFLKV